jgi:hypothetical protein
MFRYRLRCCLLLRRFDIMIIRLLLCFVLFMRWRLAWDDGSVVYRWVKDPDGGFDHWFETPEEPLAVGFYLIRFRLWRFARIILTHTHSTGLSWAEYRDDQFGRMEGYYCTEPLFAARAACSKRKRS